MGGGALRPEGKRAELEETLLSREINNRCTRVLVPCITDRLYAVHGKWSFDVANNRKQDGMTEFLNTLRKQ